VVQNRTRHGPAKPILKASFWNLDGSRSRTHGGEIIQPDGEPGAPDAHARQWTDPENQRGRQPHDHEKRVRAHIIRMEDLRLWGRDRAPHCFAASALYIFGVTKPFGPKPTETENSVRSMRLPIFWMRTLEASGEDV